MPSQSAIVGPDGGLVGPGGGRVGLSLRDTMPFIIKTTLRSIESYLMTSGFFRAGVRVGEPKSAPTPRDGTDFYASVFMDSVNVTQLFLNGGTEERHSVTIRIYKNMLSEPEEDIEFGLAEVVQKVVSDLLGDYDLGATIRNVDAAGITGAPLSTRWAYLDVAGTMYRIADIQLPLIVDDSTTAAP